jgi:hypothetical protein
MVFVINAFTESLIMPVVLLAEFETPAKGTIYTASEKFQPL